VRLPTLIATSETGQLDAATESGNDPVMPHTIRSLRRI
jgi:hypothetical protein